MTEAGTAAVRWSGAVLCGGRSRRMGQDKALIPIDGQPMALRVASALTAAGATEVVAVGGDTERLSALGLDVVRDAVVVGEPGEGGPPPGDRVGSTPAVASEGPLVGIVTALAAITTEIVMVVACDLVSPSPEAMATTVAALASAPGYDLAVPYARPAGAPADDLAVPDDSAEHPAGAGARRRPNRRGRPGDRGLGSATEPGGLVPQWLHAAWQREAWSSLAGQVAAGERAVHRAVAAAGLRVVDVEGVVPAALADADVPTDLPPPVGRSDS